MSRARRPGAPGAQRLVGRHRRESRGRLGRRVAAQPERGSREVVVADDPGRRAPRRRVRRERPVDRAAHRAGGPRAPDRSKLNAVCSSSGTEVARDARRGRGRSRRRTRAVRRAARPRAASSGRSRGRRRGPRTGAARRPGLAVAGQVREGRVLGEEMGDVDPEAVHPARQPELEDRLELGAHLGVGPVEVRLRGVEQVQVPLAGLPGVRHASPRGPAEDARPAVGWQRAVRAPSGPEEVPVARRRSGPAASASRNHGCSTEVWLGTMSTGPGSRGRAPREISASASASDPNSGSMSR